MMLTKDRVHTLEDAFVYLACCELATVDSMAMKKSKSKYEYKRHLEIAQHYIDWIKDFKIEYRDKGLPRIVEVMHNYNGVVKDWAAKYEPKEVK